MPSLQDLVNHDDFWTDKVGADQRRLLAKKVEPRLSTLGDSDIDSVLMKVRHTTPLSKARGEAPAEKMVMSANDALAGKGTDPEKLAKERLPAIWRIAGMAASLIPGTAAVRAGIGAGSEIASETAEKAAGTREHYNPLAIGMQGVTSAILPGTSGRVVKDVVKGAAGTYLSDTLNRWSRGEPAIPPAGEAAISLVAGGLTSGLASRYYRGGLHELLPREEASIAEDLLNGKVPPSVAKGWRGQKQTMTEIRAMKVAATKSHYADLPRTPFEYAKHPEKYVEKAGPAVAAAAVPTDPKIPGLTPWTNITRGIRRTKDWMDKVQKQTNLPAFEHYSAIREGLGRAKTELSKAGETLHGVFRGTPYARRVTMQAMLETDPRNRPKVAQLLSLNPGEVKKVEDLEVAMGDRFKEWGLSAKRFYREVMPKVRATGSLEAAYPTGIYPKEAEFFRKDFEEGWIGGGDRDSLSLSLRLIKRGASKTHVEPLAAAARKAVIVPGAPAEVKEHFSSYLNEVQGLHQDFSRHVADALHLAVSKIPGSNFSKQDAQHFIDTMVGLQYSSTLMLRPGPLVRNAFQGFQTGYPMIGNWYWHGVKKAFTTEGKAAAEAAGVLAGESSYLQELHLAEGMTTRGALQRTAVGLQRMQAFGMKGYSKVDDHHLVAMFNGQHDMVLDAAKRGKSVEDIVDRANLDTFTKSEADRWRGMLGRGQVKEVAVEAGKARAYDTQWSNNLPGDAPPILRGLGGRTLGSFSNWSLQYQSYLARNAFGSAPGHKKAAWFARWMLSNGIMMGVAGASAAKLGYEHPWVSALSNTYLSPAVPTGGPHMQVLIHGVGAINEHAMGMSGDETKKFKAAMKSAVTPGYYIYKSDIPDYLDIINNDPAKFLHLIGQAPKTPR